MSSQLIYSQADEVSQGDFNSTSNTQSLTTGLSAVHNSQESSDNYEGPEFFKEDEVEKCSRDARGVNWAVTLQSNSKEELDRMDREFWQYMIERPLMLEAKCSPMELGGATTSNPHFHYFFKLKKKQSAGGLFSHYYSRIWCALIQKRPSRGLDTANQAIGAYINYMKKHGQLRCWNAPLDQPRPLSKRKQQVVDVLQHHDIPTLSYRMKAIAMSNRELQDNIRMIPKEQINYTRNILVISGPKDVGKSKAVQMVMKAFEKEFFWESLNIPTLECEFMNGYEGQYFITIDDMSIPEEKKIVRGFVDRLKQFGCNDTFQLINIKHGQCPLIARFIIMTTNFSKSDILDKCSPSEKGPVEKRLKYWNEVNAHKIGSRPFLKQYKKMVKWLIVCILRGCDKFTEDNFYRIYDAVPKVTRDVPLDVLDEPWMNNLMNDSSDMSQEVEMTPMRCSTPIPVQQPESPKPSAELLYMNNNLPVVSCKVSVLKDRDNTIPPQKQCNAAAEQAKKDMKVAKVNTVLRKRGGEYNNLSYGSKLDMYERAVKTAGKEFENDIAEHYVEIRAVLRGSQ